MTKFNFSYFIFEFNLDPTLKKDQSNLSSIRISVPFFHIILIIIGTVFVVCFPMAWCFLILPLTSVSLLLGFLGIPLYVQYLFPGYRIHTTTFIKKILHALKKVRALDFFAKLYMLVFYTELKTYYRSRNICYGLTMLYIIIVRYNYYHQVILREHFSVVQLTLVSLLLFIAFIGYYVRILISMSQFICLLARFHEPDLLDPLLRIDPPDIPLACSLRKLRSFFSFHKHHHHYPPQPLTPKSVDWVLFGFFVGCASLCLGVWTYKEFAHQNDLEELAQGLITKEEYFRRHPPK